MSKFVVKDNTKLTNAREILGPGLEIHSTAH